MSNITDEYVMEAGSSGLLDTCDESRMLIESVDTIVEKDTPQSQNYYVVTEVNGDQTNLIQITGADKLVDAAESNEQNQPWDQLCRICANTSDHLIPIFKEEGLEHQLNNKIDKYLPIQVSEEDNLPLHLCYHCAATLLAWHELADGCLDAEQRLLQMQNEFQQKDRPTIVDESLDEGSAVLTTEDTEVSIKNQPSQESLAVKGESNEESTANDSERLTNYIRSPRSSSFTEFRRAYQALLHPYERQVAPIYQTFLRHKKSDQWLDIGSLNNSTDPSSPVDINDKPLKLEEEEDLASTIVLDKKKLTPISNDEKESLDLLNTSVLGAAIDASQSPDKNFEEESSKDDQDSVGEIPSVSTKISYDCKLCNKKFPLQETYRAHMSIHTDAKRFTCHICGKQFGQTGSLYYHLKHVHGGVKQHACDLCGRSFAMKAAMEDHRRIHTGERPYCCASCGKTFKTKASLYIHSKTHTDELPHKCSYCPKAFRWRQQMLGHLTIHTGQKNHICEICGKRFGVKNDLTRHKRIHSEEKPFMCQQCGLSFGQKRYLKNHERTRHR